MDVVYSHNPHRRTEIHAADCKAASRKVRGTLHETEVSAVTTSEAMEAAWRDYADEPACLVHACARRAFSKEYLNDEKEYL